MADMVFLTKLKPEPMGAHDVSKAYGVNSLVMSADGAAAYLSVKDVPAGTPLTNTEYWKIHTDLSKTKQSAEEAAAKAMAARDEMIEIARSLADPVHAEGNPNRVEDLVGGLPFDSVVTVLEPKQANENLVTAQPTVQQYSSLIVNFGEDKTFDALTLSVDLVDAAMTASTTVVNVFNFQTASGENNYVSSSDLGLQIGTTYNKRIAITKRNITCSKVYCYFTTGGYGKWTGAVAKAKLELGETATDFVEPGAPRPISGWTDAKLVRAGKNLFSGSPNKLISNGITLEKDRGSEVTVYGSAAITLGMRVFETQLPAGTYTFSIGEIGNVNRFEPCIDGTPIAQLWSGDTWTLTLEAAAAVGLNMIVSKGADCGTEDNPTRVKVQLESGADATAYEPYQGEAFSADFGQTVYGGRLDWQEGVLTVDRALATLDGTERYLRGSDWADGAYQIESYLTDALMVEGYGKVADIVGSHANTEAPQYIVNGRVGIGQGAGNTLYLNFGSQYNTTDLIKEYIAAQHAAGTPVQVVYKLAAPIEIPLTPQEIKQMEGTNTLYGDGGIVVNGRAKLISRIEALETAILNA